MLSCMVRTAAGSLLLATACLGQTSAPRELPPAPSTQIAAVRSTAIPAWARTAPTPGYVPLSTHQKFKTFIKWTYSPHTFTGVLFDTGISQATNGHPGYGGGMEGFGKRFGANFADQETGVFFKYFLFPTLFHQDPRYFQRPDLPMPKRVAYAMSRVLFTRQDNGSTGINLSYFAGGLLGSAVSNAYYPSYERGVGDTVSRFTGGILSDAALNLMNEFWPSVRKRLERTRIARRVENSRLGALVLPRRMSP